MKKTLLVLTALIGATTFTGSALAAAQENPGLKANRTICNPQNNDMAKNPSLVSICDWDNWKGGPRDAEITLTGKKEVHATCDLLSGPDVIKLVVGHKRSDNFLILPGKHFEFDVNYNEKYKDPEDENQNILFYLNLHDKQEPSVGTDGHRSKLKCTFTVKPQPLSKK